MTMMRLVIIVLVATALQPSIHRTDILSTPYLYADANISPSPSRSSRFALKRNKDESDDGLTLGDLEAMQQSSNDNDGRALIPPQVIFGQETQEQLPQEEEEPEQSTQHQLRRNLRRINLDLSGRVMCHVLSPKISNDNVDDDNNNMISAPAKMTSVPLYQVDNSIIPAQSSRLRKLYRHIPHVFLGANYDLDEIWYGATRWITKCSWHLPPPAMHSTMDDSNTRVRQLVGNIFPTATTQRSRSRWRFDLEREQSVFENTDSTMRISLGNVSPNQSSDSPSTNQHVAVEYDSAKYANRIVDTTTTTTKSTVVQAPTISVKVQTPLFHPRLELRTKTTWIVQNSGDVNDNYYGGTHFGSVSPAERRLEMIRDGYRAMVPQPQYNGNIDGGDSLVSSMTTMDRVRIFGRKVSHWLENDGWMPKRVTTDLMGNLNTISEVGFSSSHSNNPESTEKKMSVPMMDNMGIRLRISKRIDWTSLGIFPWSNNTPQQRQRSNQVPTPTRVRLDICGLHSSGDALSRIGCELDPLQLRDSFKVVIGCDGVVAAV